jgi:UDP-N-acetylmuramoyl-tripeptide--D-alanyl-D-alanine ligase
MNCKSVSIDTRKIELNSFLLLLKGDRFDANTFAEVGRRALCGTMMRIILTVKQSSGRQAYLLLQELAKFTENI